jgi:hypothetical protein
MPWLPEDAYRHTHKAGTPHLSRLWAEVANSVLAETGDEGYAVRTANAAVSRALESEPVLSQESIEAYYGEQKES